MKCKCGTDLTKKTKFCPECGIKVEKPVPVPKVAEMAQVKQVADELPEILTAQNIANYLKISRRRVYELLQLAPHAGGIPNLEIGNSKRVDKQDFLNWIEARKQEKSKKLSMAITKNK